MSPAISPQTQKKIKEIIQRYPQKEAALLPVLHIVQREFGRISSEEEKMTAELLEISPIKIREVVTFYSMFFQKGLGRYHIQVCSNLSCSLLGGDKILEYMSRKLDLSPGESTEDGKYSLSTVECLGACETAPCMMVNDEYHGHLDEKKIDKILDGLD